MKSQDPVFSFWIDKESGELKEHGNAADGFKKAIKFKWSEGVEYFYHRLNEQVKEEEITSAITTLSSVQCDHNGAVILDFCLSKMSDQAKNKLFKDSELSKKDKGVYSLLSALIHQGFFDTVQVVVSLFKSKVLANKVLSTHDYSLLLSLLSDIMLEKPESGTQARAIMMDLWKYNGFNEYKKVVVDFSNSVDPITDVVAKLVIDWKNDDNKNRAITKKGEILEMLQFAQKICSSEGFEDFRKDVIDDLRIVGRGGMKKNVDYGKLAEKLFAELDKTLPSGRGDVGGAGDPQSTLGSAEVSSFSGHSR